MQMREIDLTPEQLAKGMQQDMQNINNAIQIYEIFNMRIQAMEDGTLLALTNEKGTKEIPIDGVTSDIRQSSNISLHNTNNGASIKLIPAYITTNAKIIHHNIYKNYLILFIIDEDENTGNITHYINGYYYKDNQFHSYTLFRGDLNITEDTIIDSIMNYENDELIKIYWVDGKNTPRWLNVAITIDSDNNITIINGEQNDASYLNFSPKLNFNETITVEKLNSGGAFPAGVIQYAFTYYNKYNAESKIFHTTPLYYCTFSDRGAKADEITNNSFKITINNPDQSFQYLRIYSIHRSSLDNTPLVKVVTDIDTTVLNNRNTIEYIDTNATGYSIDPTTLFYIGGSDFIASTIATKDNTLFLGNITIEKQNLLDTTVIKELIAQERELFKNTAEFKATKLIENSLPFTYYDYKNQLNKNSKDIKTFKFGETYRFGFQLQDNNGSWTDPIWLGDLKNTQRIISPLDDTNIKLPELHYNLSKILTNNLFNLGYKKIRPLVVLPKEHEREVICQGVINPTVYNIEKRINNQPYSQASWFFRPIIPFSHGGNADLNNEYTKSSEYGVNLEYRHNTSIPSNQYRNAEIQNIIDKVYDYEGFYRQYGYNFVGYDNIENEEFFTKFFNYEKRNLNNIHADISEYNKSTYYIDQSIVTFNSPEIELSESLYYNIFENYDIKIVGLIPLTSSINNIQINSPNGSFNKGYNHTFKGDVRESLETDAEKGFVKYTRSILNNSIEGSRILAGGLFWEDNFINVHYNQIKEGNNTYYRPRSEYLGTTQYMVYPFHAERSLNNGDNKKGTIETKNISNLRFSYSTLYFNSYQNFYPENIQHTINYINDTNPITRIKKPYSFNTDNIIYQGTDIEQVTTSKYQYPLVGGKWGKYVLGLVIPGNHSDNLDDENKDQYDSTTEEVPYIEANYIKSGKEDNWYSGGHLDYRKGGNKNITINNWDDLISHKELLSQYYPNVLSKLVLNNSEDYLERFKFNQAGLGELYNTGSMIHTFNKIYSAATNFNGFPVWWRKENDLMYNVLPDSYRWQSEYQDANDKKTYNAYNYTYKDFMVNDPVTIKYKQSPHLVIAPKTSNNKEFLLPSINIEGSPYYDNQYYLDIFINPTLYSGDNNVQYQNSVININKEDDNFKSFLTTRIDIQTNTQVPCSNYGYLYLVDIINPNIQNKFGGTEESALKQNNWLICGNSYNIKSPQESLNQNQIIIWEEGDTYYQRFDCLKTYPYSEKEKNGITEILSFMCETRINLDSRTDRNRGEASINVFPTNFNLYNTGYYQVNNFFNYTITDQSILNFPTTVYWSKPKYSNSLIDEWLNINALSNITLDGKLGNIVALRSFNSNLYGFQEFGINKLNFNNRVQIPTSDNTPIEITNSMKMDTPTQLTNLTGCQYLPSIKTTEYGIYFIDNNIKEIYKLGESLVPLTSTLSLNSWAKKNLNNKFKTHYDNLNKLVYFIGNNQCLCYSEQLNCFTGFYSYEKSNFIDNMLDFTISGLDQNGIISLHKLYSGDYNYFYDDYYPYNFTLKFGTNTDKVFTNLEYTQTNRVFNNNEWNSVNNSFNSINIKNDYQEGEARTLISRNFPSVLKNKFKLWRIDIPRDGSTLNTKVLKGDRIRSPWAYIKLERTLGLDNKFELNSLKLKYLE